jgi:alkaline phosphatase
MKRLLTFLFLFTLLNTYAQQKPRKVILMIGDGMGLAQIYAGMTAKGGHLALERCRIIGLSKTNSADDYVTDSAAGATAFSIGQKTFNGAIGVDSTGKPVKTILEEAEAQGLATGLVATSSVTHATPAAFIAHQKSRKMEEEIALDFLKTPVDVFIGGGQKFFMKRKDGRNLIDSLKAKGYFVALSKEDLLKYRAPQPLAALLAENSLPRYSQGRGDLLKKAALIAIETLNKNPKGFFLMIEGSQIDWGGHNNDTQYIVEEMVDFDNTIEAVLDFAEKDGNTLVIITADHETGGFALVNGSLAKRTVEGKFITTEHTAEPVPVFAFGPGAEEFQGFYHNTEIYHKIKKLLLSH